MLDRVHSFTQRSIHNPTSLPGQAGVTTCQKNRCRFSIAARFGFTMSIPLRSLPIEIAGAVGGPPHGIGPPWMLIYRSSGK